MTKKNYISLINFKNLILKYLNQFNKIPYN